MAAISRALKLHKQRLSILRLGTWSQTYCILLAHHSTKPVPVSISAIARSMTQCPSKRAGMYDVTAQVRTSHLYSLLFKVVDLWSMHHYSAVDFSLVIKEHLPTKVCSALATPSVVLLVPLKQPFIDTPVYAWVAEGATNKLNKSSSPDLVF